MQHPVQNIAGTVAREHPARSIGSVSTRREPHYEYSRLWITKRGYRAAPILPIAIRPALGLRNLCAMDAQTGAAIAIFYFILQDFKQVVTWGLRYWKYCLTYYDGTVDNGSVWLLRLDGITALATSFR